MFGITLRSPVLECLAASFFQIDEPLQIGQPGSVPTSLHQLVSPDQSRPEQRVRHAELPGLDFLEMISSMHLVFKHQCTCMIFCMAMIVMLLSACGPKRYTGDSPYRAWLVDGESVLEAVEDGPFTLLHIDYRSGSSYLTSTHLIYYRIVYRDRIVVKQAERAGHWAGATAPSVLWKFTGTMAMRCTWPVRRKASQSCNTLRRPIRGGTAKRI